MTFLCRALGIHTDADTDPLCLTDIFIFFILCKGIKNNMVADRHQFLHVRFFISRCKNMILFSHLFISQSGFVQAAGGCAADVPPDHRIKAVHGKCFLCQQNMTACILFQLLQDFKIVSDFAFIHYITGCRQSLKHHSTVCGFSSTTHGRPYWLSMSINGSGSNSSILKTPSLSHTLSSTNAAPIIAGTPVV